jgi:glycosyltransferase involved in cell wall biosynthesis
VQAEILKNMFGGIADLDKTVVLYNGLHSEPGVQPKTFDKEGLNLLFIGHIAFSKGFYEIICAYKNLFRKYNLKLSFAGTKRFSDKNKMSILNFLKGDNLEYYLKNNDKINNTINEFVDNSEMYNAKYLGIISGEEKKKAFDDAEILLLPSYTEGFSMTVLEALFRGIPVVVTRVGAFPEIITEGVNGFFVEAGNAAQLERSITQLVLDKEKLRLISKNNIDYAVNNFGIQKISKDFENILYNV